MEVDVPNFVAHSHTQCARMMHHPTRILVVLIRQFSLRHSFVRRLRRTFQRSASLNKSSFLVFQKGKSDSLIHRQFPQNRWRDFSATKKYKCAISNRDEDDVLLTCSTTLSPTSRSHDVLFFWLAKFKKYFHGARTLEQQRTHAARSESSRDT